MSLFAKLKGERQGQGGAYFNQDGLYQVKVNRVKTGETRKKDEFFVVETEIITSNVEDHKPGSKRSQMIMFKHDAALGNIANFLQAAIWTFGKMNGATMPDGVENYEQVDPDENSALEVCAEDNPMAGVILDLECIQQDTRAGGQYTKCVWSPPEEYK